MTESIEIIYEWRHAQSIGHTAEKDHWGDYSNRRDGAIRVT